MSEYMQAPEYLCGHMKSEIKDEKTLKLIDAAYNQGRRDQASHAVVDSVAADLASKAANYKKWADRYMAGQRIGRMDGKTIDSLREARISLDAALARYDALHKEAEQ